MRRSVGWVLCLLGGCYSGVGEAGPPDRLSGGHPEDSDGGSDDGEPEPEAPELEVEPTHMRRLTRAQYLQSVRDLLALPQWTPQTQLPDEGVNEEEFQLPNMVAGTVTTGPVGYNRYRVAAKEAAALAFATDADVQLRLGCSPQSADDPCVTDYLMQLCERAFGRSLSEQEPVIRELRLVVEDAAERLGHMRLGLQWAVISVLQSPEFLYFYPMSDGEGGMDAYSKARSLALMFRDSVPDATLLAHARDGSLDDPAVLDMEIDRLIGVMLDDPERRGAVQRFFDEWWSMNVVEQIGKNAELFPEFDESLRTSMKREFELWLQDIVFERRLGFDAVFNSDRTFANDRLAELYGLPGVFGDEFVAVELDESSPRSGLLSNAAFLSVMAHPAQTSPAARGRFVTERLFCLTIPPPPQGVDTTLPPPQGPETKRERFVRHTTDPTCAGCHSMMDPSGLALEEFDAIGRFRREETVVYEGESYTLPLDTSGDLFGVPFENSRELSTAVGQAPELTRCVVRQLLRHELGRELGSGETVAINELEAKFIDSDLDFIELMRQVARHRVFNSFAEAE